MPDKLRTTADIAACVDLYRALSDEAFITSDRNSAIRNLWALVRQRRFVRCIRRNGVIEAWIYADRVHLPHRATPHFQQIYYASSVSGIRAARYVVALHDIAAEYAKAEGYDLITSPGSHMDPDNVFARILEKNGWQRRGYLAAKAL